MLGLSGIQRGWVTAVALLVSVFMAGVLSAVAVVTVLDRQEAVRLDDRRPAHPRMGGPGGPAEGPRRGGRPDRPWGFDGRGDQVLDVLTEELALSEAQREQIGDIMASREARTDEVMSQVRERLTAIMDSIHAEIQEVLTPEQSQAYQEFLREGRDRLERRFPGPPGRRPPPDDRRRGPRN